MAKLSEKFKTRDEICAWLINHKRHWEEAVGVKLNILSSENGEIIAEIKDSRDLKITCIPEFDMTEETLIKMEKYLNITTPNEKFAGAVVLAENIDTSLSGHLATLKYSTMLFRIFLLEVGDGINNPVFKECPVMSIKRVV